MDTSTKKIGLGRVLRLLVLTLAVFTVGFVLHKENKDKPSAGVNPLACIFPEARADGPGGPGGPVVVGDCCECCSC